ncbi:hypothetical protein ABI59_22945 [Acidobacteria bacterium Mor1]|nr:hypothetical protein ABI59_22945 [Acidobacteria bacterium Mor1]
MDDVERAFRQRFVRLLESTPAPFDRGQFIPGHVTASAFILSPAGDALLLIRHPTLGRWLQPGGHVEPGDADVLEAARREAEEEVGLRGLPLAARAPGLFDLDIHPIPARGAEPGHEHFDVRFLFQSPTESFQCGHETRQGAWTPLAELETRMNSDSAARIQAKLKR